MQVIMSIFYSSQLLLKESNSVLPEQEIRESFYQLVGILQNIFLSVQSRPLDVSHLAPVFFHFHLGLYLYFSYDYIFDKKLERLSLRFLKKQDRRHSDPNARNG